MVRSPRKTVEIQALTKAHRDPGPFRIAGYLLKTRRALAQQEKFKGASQPPSQGFLHRIDSYDDIHADQRSSRDETISARIRSAADTGSVS